MSARLPTVLAGGLLWGALALPDERHEVSVGSFLRIPLEGLLLVAALLVLPSRLRRPLAVLAGVALGLLVLVKALDLGFSAVLDRRFHEAYDWSYLGLGYAVLGDWVGDTAALVALVVIAVVALGVVVLLVPAMLRVSRVITEHPRTSWRVLAVASVVWVAGALTGLQVLGAPVASVSTSRVAYDHAQSLVTDLRAEEDFSRSISEDPFLGDTDLLAGLQGKDVLLIWVESYGRVALTDPAIAPDVTEVLEAGGEELTAAGVAARSAYLTAPTFGGSSWLSHATLQSGLWTDNQHRYEQLLDADRLTLTSAFGGAGWRTVFVLPAVERQWPEGESFYSVDELVTGPDLGYRGPELGWGRVPDQFTLAALRRSVLEEADRPPVMAQVDLVTSHLPWPPPPPVLAWDDVGDGTAYRCMPGCGRDPAEVEGMDHVRERYRDSVGHVLRTVTSFVASHPDPDLVVLLTGDHQPWSYVSGTDPGHDVPVTILAADPDVLRRVADWGWTPGLLPAPDAPVWRMDAFRDRFLAAFE